MKDLFKNYLPLLVIGLAYLGLYILENRAVITSAQREAIMLILGIGAPAVTLHMPVPQRAAVPPSGVVAVLLMVALAAPMTACTPAQRSGVPVLSTVDAVGRGLSHVLGWCEENGADESRLAKAERATENRDYLAAIALASEMVRDARKEGAAVPEDVEVTLRLAEGLMAAHAIEQGMRALSTPSTAKPDGGS